MVDGTGLENRKGSNSLVGSNPTPSAKKRRETIREETKAGMEGWESG
jgi:hypothetical protein